jgi:hypothetical protein
MIDALKAGALCGTLIYTTLRANRRLVDGLLRTEDLWRRLSRLPRLAGDRRRGARLPIQREAGGGHDVWTNKKSSVRETGPAFRDHVLGNNLLQSKAAFDGRI